MSKSTKVIASLGVVAALGVSFMPFAGASAYSPATPATQNVTLQYGVNENISMTIAPDGGEASSSAITHTERDITNNASVNTANSDAIAITTNAMHGYTLSVKTATAETALTNEGTGTIPGIATTAAPMTKGHWGIHVAKAADATLGAFPATVSEGTQNFLAPTASNQTVVSHGNLATKIENETSTVTYGVQAADGQPAGLYTITLTYTAAANNS